MAKLLRRYPNLYCDLSDYTAYNNALARDLSYTAEFVKEFEDRMFFGTDIVVPDMLIPLIDDLKKWKPSQRQSHPVASRGQFAADLVKDHASGKERYGVFGELCFGHESPWQRMFDSRTRYSVKCYVLFWVVDTVYDIFKHFAEYRTMEKWIERAKAYAAE
ncbi:MAG: hypothetical protein IJX80_08020 [Clostridia bacterium]|nr:hypothetical protein [Clostridia bacterium]